MILIYLILMEKNIPRIILTDRKFDDLMSKIQGKPISVNTNLNILQDGLGHVFVEITLDFFLWRNT